MSTKITIKPGDVNHHLIYDGVNDIFMRITKWKNERSVEKAEFRVYPKDKYKIENVYFCTVRDQLEISVIHKKTTEPFNAEFSNFRLNENKEEDVIVIQFAENEQYIEEKCVDPDDDTQPERKRGNILVGG